MKTLSFSVLVFSAAAYNPIVFNLSVEFKVQLCHLLVMHKISAVEDDAFGELSFDTKNISPVFSYQQAASAAPIIYQFIF